MALLHNLSQKTALRHNTPCAIRHKKMNTQNGRKSPFLKPRWIVRSAASAFLRGACSMGIQRSARAPRICRARRKRKIRVHPAVPLGASELPGETLAQRRSVVEHIMGPEDGVVRVENHVILSELFADWGRAYLREGHPGAERNCRRNSGSMAKIHHRAGEPA